ncbi:hemerythrin domain-containing protein [Streptomyces puniciscabiei]
MSTTVNPYRTIHKAQRAHLFALSTELGTAEAGPEALKSLVKRTSQLIQELEEHAGHEDRFLHPLLGRYVPEIVKELDEQHAHLELAFERLDALGAEVEQVAPDALAELAHDIYLALNHVIGLYLVHLNAEEAFAWPALARASSDAEVVSEVIEPFLASKSEEFGLQDAADQLPHVAPHERVAIVRATLAGMPDDRHQGTMARLTGQLDTAAIDRLRNDLPPEFRTLL